MVFFGIFTIFATQNFVKEERGKTEGKARWEKNEVVIKTGMRNLKQKEKMGERKTLHYHKPSHKLLGKRETYPKSFFSFFILFARIQKNKKPKKLLKICHLLSLGVMFTQLACPLPPVEGK